VAEKSGGMREKRGGKLKQIKKRDDERKKRGKSKKIK
jgi:hypothetical protein